MTDDDTNRRGDSSDNQSTADSIGRLERRDYLRSVGIAGLLGGLGVGAGVPGTVGAQQANWEDEADDRIEEYRAGDLEVDVVNPDGSPVDGATVEVTQQAHEYSFGTMIHAEFLIDQAEWGEEMHTPEDQVEYEETVEDLFNMVVLENLHKWNLWEDNIDIADAAVDWAVERDMDVRGHVALWGNIDGHAVPPRVVEAMGDPWASDWDEAGEPDYDPEYVVSEAMDHIEEIISHYGDDVAEWEVKNEVIHETAMIEAVEGENADPVEAEILGDWYEHAEDVANQYGVDIAVNDFNTLVGPYQDTRDDYERQIDYLVNDRGIDLDGIGFQCHFAANETLEPDAILDGLEQFEGYGAGFRASEFDTFQGNWSSPDEQGEYLYDFMKTWFSHPNTDAFLVWGHWDGVHWGPEYDGSDADAPLFDEDWNEKPGYDAYTDLVFDEWWTDESGTSDDGVYETTAFLGEHEITVSTDAESTTETVSVTDADGTRTVEITVEGDGNGDEDPGNGDNGDNGDDDNGDGDYPEWDADEVYTEGDRVSWDGTNWEAQWWTQNQEPGTNQWGPWEEV
ncbi:endo-1,4-beta-xylanase [Natronolimnobius baerhuensis]|uniref:endo-1,4-beta-xylanase n=1 Tax=Natronolimnobius baerhuensis TaxID=253108 RepID=A0A202E954_9EURY|nr:endo-1,4-beta-xylanase [Natronolimnobius baerhuensis]OVE84698.1 hypothetical protein B2G88_09945 [Natronolimnobius baerhuensis]